MKWPSRRCCGFRDRAVAIKPVAGIAKSLVELAENTAAADRTTDSFIDAMQLADQLMSEAANRSGEVLPSSIERSHRPRGAESDRRGRDALRHTLLCRGSWSARANHLGKPRFDAAQFGGHNTGITQGSCLSWDFRSGRTTAGRDCSTCLNRKRYCLPPKWSRPISPNGSRLMRRKLRANIRTSAHSRSTGIGCMA